MEPRTRKFTVAAATVMLILTATLGRGLESPSLALVVYVSNQASVERSSLREAQAQTDRIFKDVGVRLVWKDLSEHSLSQGCELLSSVVVTLLSPAMVREASRLGGSATALGSAVRNAGRASIHPERIQELALRTRRRAGELMGRVMAHEIGHLLLPNGHHASSGIMMAGMETDPTAPARFAFSEKRVIKAALASRAEATESRSACEERRVAERD